MSDEHTRLYRVDGTRRSQTPVEGLTGRWFSDDAYYIDRSYARAGTRWTYIDIPRDLADSFRYENVVRTEAGRDLFGWEGKDFILPDEWVSQRVPCDRPVEAIAACQAIRSSRGEDTFGPLPIRELTSNCAKAGRVLRYDRSSGNPVRTRISVVESVQSGYAVILTKEWGPTGGQRVPDQSIRQLVPIRIVKAFDR